MHRSEYFSTERSLVLIGASLLVFIGIVVSFSNRPMTFDEEWYLRDAKLLEQVGFGVQYIQRMTGPTGPIHAVVHRFTSPLTGFAVPGIRMISFFVFLSLIGLLTLYFRVESSKHPLAWGVLLVGAPNLVVIGALALTDITAIWLYTAHLCLFLLLLKKPSYSLALATGVLLSLAVSGRQSYLAMLGPMVLAALIWRQPRRYIVAAIATSLVLPSILFFLWGGILPPISAKIYRGPLIWIYFLVACSYTAILQAIYDPQFLFKRNKLCLFFYATVMAIWGGIQIFNPSDMEKVLWYGAASKVLPREYLLAYNTIVMPVFFTVGLLFAVHLVEKCWEHRIRNKRMFFLYASILVSMVACIKMGYFFSFRYIASTAPLLILIAFQERIPLRGLMFRVTAGGILGLLLLAGYLQII